MKRLLYALLVNLILWTMAVGIYWVIKNIRGEIIGLSIIALLFVFISLAVADDLAK